MRVCPFVCVFVCVFAGVEDLKKENEAEKIISLMISLT